MLNQPHSGPTFLPISRFIHFQTMDKDYFNNGGVPLSQYEPAMAVPWSGSNCPSDLPYLNPSSSFGHPYSQFDSSLTSIVSSSVAPSSALCELIGKFGGSGSSASMEARHYAGNIVSEESNFGNHLSSPKLRFPMVDQRNPSLGNPASLPPPPPPLAAIAADPAFIERAAKFSCFGSRSFNGRTSPIGHGSGAQPLTAAGETKLPRVSSSPTLKPPNGSPLKNHNSGLNLAEISPGMTELDRKLGKLAGSAANSNEESSVSDQIETAATETNSRKRKGSSRGKPKEEGSASVKVDSDDGIAKRSKPTTESTKTEPNEGKGCSNNDESEKQKADKKAPEPPKDYIHVRARRGQATDSHSLAERVRREKISERMKLLQDLVPGCNKVTGKALMLDEIINYVQSLQRQVEFLSMKLASVNPSLDFNMENLLSKDVFQQQHNTPLPQPQMYPLDASANVYRQNVQQELHDANVSRGPLVDPPTLHFPCLDGFNENLPQFPGFIEDDLHSIVQMGFVQNSVNFPDMKVER